MDPKGREHSRTFTRKVDAEKFLVSIEGSKLYGEWVDPALGKTTLGDWAAQWMKTTVHHKPRTRAGNESLL
ncbi:MAG: site-specific integrase, partial [Actinomycetota bacterium]